MIIQLCVRQYRKCVSANQGACAEDIGIMRCIGFLMWLIMLLTVVKIASGGNPDAKRLYDDLLSNYNKLVRPVVNVSEAVTVRLKLKLSQLIDVVSRQCMY